MLNDKEIPLAYGHFLHTQTPYGEYFGVDSSKRKEQLVIETSKKYKTPFVSCLLGFKKFVVVTDFDSVHEINIKKSKTHLKPIEIYKLLDIFGPNVLVSVGSEWQHQRVLFNPVFTQETYLKFVCGSTVKCTKKLMSLKLKETVNEVQLREPFKKLALDVLSTSVFGFETNGLDPIDFDQYKHGEIPSTVSMTLVDALMNSIHGLVMKLLLPSVIYNLPFFKKQKNSVHDFQEYMKFILEKCRKNKVEDNLNDSLVKLMVKSQDGEERQLSDKELISNMFIFFFAGHETTAGTMHWAMILLARNQEAQEKFHHEVASVLEGRDATYEDYGKLKYTQAVLKEVLRMHTPVKATVKVNTEKSTIGGRVFPKGTIFQSHMQAIHYDERYYENPYEFQPERFLKEHNPSHYMPFSYGKRNCIGYKFAEVEGAITLATLIQNYSIHLKDGINASEYEEETSFVTSTPKHDLPFILRKRIH
eukprot:gene4021-7277_t